MALLVVLKMFLKLQSLKHFFMKPHRCFCPWVLWGRTTDPLTVFLQFFLSLKKKDTFSLLDCVFLYCCIWSTFYWPYIFSTNNSFFLSMGKRIRCCQTAHLVGEQRIWRLTIHIRSLCFMHFFFVIIIRILDFFALFLSCHFLEVMLRVIFFSGL